MAYVDTLYMLFLYIKVKVIFLYDSVYKACRHHLLCCDSVENSKIAIVLA